MLVGWKDLEYFCSLVFGSVDSFGPFSPGNCTWNSINGLSRDHTGSRARFGKLCLRGIRKRRNHAIEQLSKTMSSSKLQIRLGNRGVSKGNFVNDIKQLRSMFTLCEQNGLILPEVIERGSDRVGLYRLKYP